MCSFYRCFQNILPGIVFLLYWSNPLVSSPYPNPVPILWLDSHSCWQYHFPGWDDQAVTTIKLLATANDNNSSLVQVMAWCQRGTKPLPEPMLKGSETYVITPWPQWVNSIIPSPHSLILFPSYLHGHSCGQYQFPWLLPQVVLLPSHHWCRQWFVGCFAPGH